jgi:DNA-binding IclR family transcriptional regulator
MAKPSGNAGQSGPQARRSPAPALDRGLRLLEFLRSRLGGASVSEIAGNLRIPLASAYRLVDALETHGFVVRDDGDGRCRLGSGILLLAGSMLTGLDVRALSRPHMQELFDRTKETVELSVLESHHLVVIDKIEGEESVHTLNVGGHRPPFRGSAGLVLLAGLSPQRLEKILQRLREEGQGGRMVVGPKRLAVLLEKIRRQGFMLDEGPGFDRAGRRSRRLAVPIRDHMGRSRAALSLVVAVSRWRPDRCERLLRHLRRTADRINQLMGFQEQLGKESGR